MEEMATSMESFGAIAHDLSDGVETTSASVEELSATFQEVAAGAGELEQVTETTLSAVEQIIVSIGAIEQKVKESAACRNASPPRLPPSALRRWRSRVKGWKGSKVRSKKPPAP